MLLNIVMKNLLFVAWKNPLRPKIGQFGCVFIFGISALVISFAQAAVEDSNTVALWHMDSEFTTSSRTWTADDDGLYPGRDNDLAYGNGGNVGSTYPVLTTGSGGYDGEAMVFNRAEVDMAFAPDGWGGHDSVQIEMSFKQDNATGEQTLISLVGGIVELRLEAGVLYFYSWYEDINGNDAGHLTLTRPYDQEEWNHVTASVNDDVVTLDVNGSVTITSVSQDPASILDDTAGYIYLGCKLTGSRNYDGLIDEVEVSKPESETVEYHTHPLLFFGSSDLPQLRQKIKETELVPIWDSILAKANDYCIPSSPDYIDPASLSSYDLWLGRHGQGWLETIGFVYLITNNPLYGQHGANVLEALALAAPVNELYYYNMDIMRTLAVGYDWLYDAMTPAQRAIVEQRGSEYCLWWYDFDWGPYHNFNGVGSGGTGLLSIVLRDIYPTATPGWIDHCHDSVKGWFNLSFDSKGAYSEGHDYMQYGFNSAFAFAEALRLNDGRNLLNEPNVMNIAHYLAMTLLPGEDVCEARNDASYGLELDESLLLAINAWDDGLLAWLWDKSELHWNGDYSGDVSYSPMRILWDRTVTPVDVIENNEPLAELFPERGLCVWRTGWDVNDLLFTIEAGQFYLGTHNQADKGHFGLYGLGYRWAVDAGYGNNRDANGRCQTVAHNSILVDGAGQALSGASYGTNGTIDSYNDCPDYGYAMANCTEAYNTNNHGEPGAIVEHALRHSIFVRAKDDIPAYAVLLDDIKKDANAHDFTWQLLSGDNMEILFDSGCPVVSPIEYVETPEGTGGTGECAWSVNITEPGQYTLWGRVRSNGEFVSSSDSWVIGVDNQLVEWHFEQDTSRSWTWDKVVSGTSYSEVFFNLDAGEHIVRVRTRERGAQLNRVVLTKDSVAPPFPPLAQGFLLTSAEASVTAPMVYVPRDAKMKVMMDANGPITYETDTYEPGDGRVPKNFPRLKATVHAENPRFLTVMVPQHIDAEDPNISFDTTIEYSNITIEWPYRTDVIVWSESQVQVDIGCFRSIADLNDDCDVNIKDFKTIAGTWLTTDASGDLNQDNFVDLLDLVIFAQAWLTN